jgi:hypothetical protein
MSDMGAVGPPADEPGDVGFSTSGGLLRPLPLYAMPDAGSAQTSPVEENSDG